MLSFWGILFLAIMPIEDHTCRTQRLLKVRGEKTDFFHNMNNFYPDGFSLFTSKGKTMNC